MYLGGERFELAGARRGGLEQRVRVDGVSGIHQGSGSRTSSAATPRRSVMPSRARLVLEQAA